MEMLELYISLAESMQYLRNMSAGRGRTLYEEVWECRSPTRQTLEEDLLSLQALAPDMIEDLRCLFKEAVTDSLSSVLGENQAMALVKLISETDFENPPEVFAALDSIFRGGAQILKEAIIDEFRASVHLLLGKVEKRAVPKPKAWNELWTSG